MDSKKKMLAVCLASSCMATNAYAGLMVSPSGDADVLADSILGDDISLVGTPTYTGASNASGTFSGGNSAGIGIDTGLLLTSGSVENAVGPNNDPSTTTDNELPGDDDLDTLVPVESAGTNDASILQFDFTSTTNELFFNFTFASEEYNEYVGSEFNDVFGFFLDGDNIALIPGTSTPVAINNVNCGDGSSGSGGGVNCGSFNDNTSSDDGSPYDIEYDGFTDVFTAEALGLAEGTHTIKLAIADTSDHFLDSGVFIEGGSFSGNVNPPGDSAEVPEPGTLFLFVTSLLGMGLAQRNRKRTWQ